MLSDYSLVRLRSYQPLGLSLVLGLDRPTPLPFFPPAVVSWIGTCSRCVDLEGLGRLAGQAVNVGVRCEACGWAGGNSLYLVHFLSNWVESYVLPSKVV